MANIQILVGSVYGAAEQVAEIAADTLRECGHDVSLNTYARAEDIVRDADEVLLLCHSKFLLLQLSHKHFLILSSIPEKIP